MLTQTAGWRWIFWFLTILISCHGVLLVLFFPETQRKLVGNGSKRVYGLLYQNLFWKVTRQQHVLEKETRPEDRIKRKVHIPNPLACVPMLFEKGSFCTMFFGGVTYAVKMTIQASLGSQCISIYNLNYLEAGLVYLPAGVAGGLGAKCTGRFLDWYCESVRGCSISLHSQYFTDRETDSACFEKIGVCARSSMAHFKEAKISRTFPLKKFD